MVGVRFVAPGYNTSDFIVTLVCNGVNAIARRLLHLRLFEFSSQ